MKSQNFEHCKLRIVGNVGLISIFILWAQRSGQNFDFGDSIRNIPS